MKFPFFRFIFLLYPLVIVYVGAKLWNTFFKYIPYINKLIYWIIFGFISLSYLFVQAGDNPLPYNIKFCLTWLGSYWLAVIFYLMPILVIVDIIKLLDRFTGIIPIWLKSSSDKPAPVTFVVLFLIISILIYGTWNARNPQVIHYNLNIPKQAGLLSQLHIVMISDSHFDMVNNRNRVEQMVNIINSLQPDIVLLAGDIYDDRDINVFEREQMGDILKQIHSEYGVYGVLGNHEYISGNADSIIKKYEEANIKMLRDNTVKVQNSFYIIGRDDLSGNHYKDKRKDLSQLMEQTDKKLPIILLDHQPSHLEEADALGVDLQLSGHTHAGQLFPNRFITKRMYEVDRGYLAKSNLQIIVSSGFGTWGPPIRTSSKSEIVDINLQFGEVSKP